MHCHGLRGVRALTLAVGLAVSVTGASADQTTPSLTTRRAGGQTSLVLNGATVHSTSAAVSGQRAVPFGNGSVAVVWSEAAGGKTTPMYAISLNGSSIDLVSEASYEIGLAYAPFDPLRGVPAVPGHLQAQPGNELYIVQYLTQPLPAMQEAVSATGAVIERYLPQLAQVVRMTPEEKAQVSALPFVRWVGAYHPAYRADTSTLAVLMGAGDTGGTPARYSIETLRSGPAQQQALGALITALGGQVNVQTLDQFRMEATLTPAQLLAVARRNEVNFIDPWGGPGGTDMDIIRQLGGAVPILSGVGITGQGVRGEIFDTGVVPTHQQWNGQVPLTHIATALDSHGNACYGVNFATGTGNVQATGLNPNREQGIFCVYTSVSQFGGGVTRLTANQQAIDPLGLFRSCYQTSSVGSAQITTYSTISAETDNYLFVADYMSCQSQSNLNSQNSRPQAWAKNIMAVGGIDHNDTLVKTDDIFPGASFGYASDGRMKPELSHSYWDVFTTYSTATTGYGQFNGTSSATPITAGHFGLLHQMWHQGVWSGHGGGATVFASRPRTTTARAIMIAGAFRYDWALPSLENGFINATLTRNRQGWGMADLGRLYNTRARTFIVNETDDLAPLANKSYDIVVAPGEQRLAVTLVYADPQGNPAVQSQHRVNNVDLRVTDPAGTVYNGNWGLTQPTGPAGAHSNWSVAGGNTDTKNTVENVWIFQPAAGNWKVEVIATEVVQDGNPETPVVDVDYGLVVLGGVEDSDCYPDCNGDGQLTVADFGCFQTEFVAGNMYADCNADGQLTAADFGCFQTSFVTGCP